jgi:hypothetical protein
VVRGGSRWEVLHGTPGIVKLLVPSPAQPGNLLILASQIPIEKWHEILGDPTFADAIPDRLVHNAYKLKLKGGSMRKKQPKLTQPGHLAT